MKNKDLIIKQLDRQFENMRLKTLSKPRQGWIRTIRKALGMTGQQLAKRLGVVRTRIVRIELDEQRDAVTLRTLREVAEALNCELVYTLVPKVSLQATLNQQAEKKATHTLDRVSHSMQLENQGISAKSEQELKGELVNSLLQGPYKHLWEEDE